MTRVRDGLVIANDSTSTGPPVGNTKIRSQQRLYPLFGIGFAFIAVGLYFGLHAYRMPPQLATRDFIDLPVRLVSPDEMYIGEGSEATHFRYHPASETTYVVELRQIQEHPGESGSLAVETRIGLEMKQNVHSMGMDDTDEPLRIDRSFHDIRVDVLDRGQRVGGEISRQLELLMENTRQSLFIAPNGPTQRMIWTSDTNPQIRQTQYLIHDALELVMPHLRFDAVLPGESWTYRLEPRQLVELDSMEADGAGSIVFHQHFDGFYEDEGVRLGVLAQRIELSFEGMLAEPTERKSFSITGEGEGLVFFDLETGQVAASSLTLQRQVRQEGQDPSLTGRIELSLRRTSPRGSALSP
jgi:hypothetical protein